MRREDVEERLKVSHNVLYDMLEAGAAVAPPQEGRIRDWTEREVEIATHAVTYKRQGVPNYGEVRMYQWIDGLPVPAFTGKFDDRAVLSRAYTRFRNSLTQNMRVTTPKAILRAMGEVDETVAHVSQFEDRELVGVYGYATSGYPEQPLSAVAERILHSMSRTGIFRIFPIKILLAKIDTRLVLDTVLSMLGKPEAVRTSIANASNDTYCLARRYFWLTVRMFEITGFEKVSRSLRLDPRWKLATFLMLLHAIYRLRNTALAFTPELANFAERWFEKLANKSAV